MSDASWSDVVLLLRCDAAGSPQDYSSVGYATSGPPDTVDTANKKYGPASYFFSGDDSMTVTTDGSHPISNFYQGNFTGYTVECWFMLSGAGTGGLKTLAHLFGAYLAYTGADDKISVTVGGTTVTSVALGLTSSTWYHVAWVKNGTGTKVFINGSAIIDTTGLVYPTTTDGSFVSFGARYSAGSPTGFLVGNLDEIRLTKSARYTTDFAPPTGGFPANFVATGIAPGTTFGSPNELNAAVSDPEYSNVRLLLHCDGANTSTSFPDASTQIYTVTANGDAQVSTAQSVFGGASAVFDGTGDYLVAGVNTDWSWMHQANAKWTIEARTKITNFTARRTLFNTSSSGGSSAGIWLRVDTDRTIKLDIFRAVFTTFVVTGSFSTLYPNDSNWHALAVQWDYTLGSANATLFIDGVASGTLNRGNTATTDPAYEALRIGGFTTTGEMLGYMDEIRITKDVVRYSGNYTPSTAQFPGTPPRPVVGIAPTTALGSPVALKQQFGQPIGATPSTALGTPFAIYNQAQTPTGIAPATAFGTPLAVHARFLNVTGIAATTALGAPSRSNRCAATGIASTTTVSPAYFRFNQVLQATSVESSVKVRTKIAFKYTKPLNVRRFRPPAIRSTVQFGTPSAV